MRLSGLQITMAAQAREKIRYWTEATTLEVSGLGLVDRVAGGFLITDVFLVEQTSTSSGTELDNEAVARLLMELDKQGIDTGKLKFWYHSHAQMDVFWSGTDEACIQELGGEQGEYFVSLVTNRKGDVLLRCDIYRPFRATFDQLPLTVGTETPGLRDACKLEVEQKVERAMAPIMYGRFQNYRSARSAGWGDLWGDEEWDLGPEERAEAATRANESCVSQYPELIAEVQSLRERAQIAERKWVQSISDSLTSLPPS